MLRPIAWKSLLTFAGIMLIFGSSSAQKVNKDSLRHVIRTQKDDTLRVDAMNKLALYILNHEQDEPRGLALLDSTLASAKKANYDGGIFQTMITRGNYFRRTSKWREAIGIFRELTELRTDVADSLRRFRVKMMANNNLAGIYNINGDYTTALQYRFASLHVAERLGGDSTTKLIIYTNIGSDYRQLRIYQKAKQFLDTADKYKAGVIPARQFDYLYERHSLAQFAGDTAMMGSSLREMETLLERSSFSRYQQLDLAQEYYKLKGQFYRDFKRQYADAILAHTRALGIAEEMDEEKNTVAAMVHLGETYARAKNTESALPLLQNAYTKGLELNVAAMAERAARTLSSIYEEKGQYKEALTYWKSAEQLHDSVDLSEKLKEINFIEAKYEDEKKTALISKLEKQNLQKEIGLSRQRSLLWISVGVVAALIIIALLLLRLAHHRRLLARQQELIQDKKIQSLVQQQQVLSLQAMINGQETERVRVARDLHDSLGGLFSTVKMHYSSLERDTPELRNNELYRKTLGLIDNAANELRRVAHNMMPEVLMKVGLDEALTDLCNNITAAGKLDVRLQSYGLDQRVEKSTEVMLYRIIQELLNNVVKHAGAENALLQINRQADAISVIVEDNGKGFDTGNTAKKNTMGMATVKSRVDYLNGTVAIDSAPGIGTTVSIHVPLEKNSQA